MYSIFMDNWKFNLINCDIFMKTNENFFQWMTRVTQSSQRLQNFESESFKKRDSSRLESEFWLGLAQPCLTSCSFTWFTHSCGFIHRNSWCKTLYIFRNWIILWYFSIKRFFIDNFVRFTIDAFRYKSSFSINLPFGISNATPCLLIHSFNIWIIKSWRLIALFELSK
jgi:hypothetical protein